MWEFISDLENGPSPRIIEEIPSKVWNGIRSVIEKYFSEKAFFGMDDNGDQFFSLLDAYLPGIWPLSENSPPKFLSILDLIQFCYSRVERPTIDNNHLYQEYQYEYNLPSRKVGQIAFRQDINRIFQRNGIVFELTEEGSIIRVTPEWSQKLLQESIFHTGDSDLDGLLITARKKYQNSDFVVRKESLEKLWDAWERLKTIEVGDKKASIATLLTTTSPEPNFYNRLDKEASELTEIGNKFRIRHHEIDNIPIESSDHVDYLFHRMFSLIYLILKSTNRIK